MGFWQPVRRWLVAERGSTRPLAGRPPASSPPAPGTGPPVAAAAAELPPRPARRTRAVCCSGGGIRAAAFALGGVQGLQQHEPGARSWYDDVDLVSAVSGGSYLAGSLAMVNHDLAGAPPGHLPPYAMGSPEDNRLRNHTRYLAEDPGVAAVGVLSILYGLLLNLIPILAGCYVAAQLLGWALSGTGVLAVTDEAWQVHHTGTAGAIAAGLAGAGLLAFVAERVHDVYRPPRKVLTGALRAWALRLIALAAVFALAVLALPFLLQLLNTAHGPVRGPDFAGQLGTFAGTVVGLVGLVRATIGRFKGKLQTSTDGTPSRVATWAGKALRAVTPWLGSALVVALLLVAFVAWTAGGAYLGPQPHEFLGIAVAILAVLGWQAVTDINRNSVHPFYKERLSSAYAVHRTQDGAAAEELPYQDPVRFSTYSADKPELIVCAAVNTDEAGVVPSGRGCAPFTFSPHLTGISSELSWTTEQYERKAGLRLLTLPAAIAVSGAAVSPVMGRMTRAPLRLLLGLANVRLGLWLPNPRRDDLKDAPEPGASGRQMLAWQWRQPGIVCLLREILGSVSLRGRWIYVTDGGHYENLGLVEALRRGVTEIVAFDASGDPPDSWITFGEAVQTARADLGVEIDLDPSRMRPAGGSDRSPTLVVPGTCTYPNGAQAALWYCKLALPEQATASWDVYAWKSGHSRFPHDPTSQQLYGDREFEAYRRLGELAARTALDAMAQHRAEAEVEAEASAPPPVLVSAGAGGNGNGSLPGHDPLSRPS
jgi:hypothetical protein